MITVMGSLMINTYTLVIDSSPD